MRAVSLREYLAWDDWAMRLFTASDERTSYASALAGSLYVGIEITRPKTPLKLASIC
jgi:hypothetical protein